MLNDFLSILFPSTCALCDQGLSGSERLICLKCLHRLPRYRQEVRDENIYLHFSDPHRYEGFYAYLNFLKKGITQKLLHQIKYNHLPELGERIGYLLGLEMVSMADYPGIDLVLPVPLHPEKKKKRGYNQSDFFARGIARGLKTAWSADELRRTVNNESQTDKNRQERIKNVSGIFSIVTKNNLIGKHILIVDDVVTTGATLESCATAVLESVPCKISFAALAVAR